MDKQEGRADDCHRTVEMTVLIVLIYLVLNLNKAYITATATEMLTSFSAMKQAGESREGCRGDACKTAAVSSRKRKLVGTSSSNKVAKVEQPRSYRTIVEGTDKLPCKVVSIPGDGRCLFRSVAYAISAQCQSDDKLQEELADKLRNDAMDALVERRTEKEFIVEGDFDEYVETMRHPEKFGGEPEIHMLSHVLKRPISVYMKDAKLPKELKVLAEHGQEYKREELVRLWYQAQEEHYTLVIAT